MLTPTELITALADSFTTNDGHCTTEVKGWSLIIRLFGGGDGDCHEFEFQSIPANNQLQLIAINGVLMVPDLHHVERYITFKLDNGCDCPICMQDEEDNEEGE